MEHDLIAPLQVESTPLLLSAEQLKQWGRCHKQFYYKTILGLRWPSTPFNFELGRQVHHLLDATAQKPKLPLASILPDTLPQSQQLLEALAHSSFGEATVLASEWAFSVPAPMPKAYKGRPVWLNGRIDRLSQKGDKLSQDGESLLVIDWKTGTAIPKQAEMAWQTRLYLYAALEAREQLGLPELKAEQLSFAYVEASDKGLNAVSIPYNATKHEATRLALQENVTAMLGEFHFALPQACPDTYCPYLSCCGIGK